MSEEYESATELPEENVASASPVEAPRGWQAAFRALRHRNFRLFFGGQFTSLIGTWMQMVAQSWLVLKLSNSPLMLGVVSFANYVPVLAVTLFAGVVIDHVERRRLIIAAQTLLMLAAFVLAWLTWSGVVRVEHVILLAAFTGLVSAFDLPARQAFVVEMVGKDDLPNAIALNSMIFNGARTIGPAIAGVLIAITGTALCFFVNGLSFLAVIWSLFAMVLPEWRRPRGENLGMFSRLREGLSYVWEHRPTRVLLIVVAFNSGFGVTYSVLIPIFARDILAIGAHGYGFLMAAQGVGAVLGGIYLASHSGAGAQLRQTITAGLLCSAAATVLFGASRSPALSMAAQVAIGAGIINFMAGTNTLLQFFVSDHLRGRVMSVYTLSFMGLAPMGSLEVGYLGECLGPPIAVMICGAVSLICGLFLLLNLPVIAEAQAAHGGGFQMAD